MVTKAIFRDGRYFDFDFELICVGFVYTLFNSAWIYDRQILRTVISTDRDFKSSIAHSAWSTLLS